MAGLTEVQASAHILDFGVNERRFVDLEDRRYDGLVAAGLLIPVTADTLPTLPPAAKAASGCGCGE